MQTRTLVSLIKREASSWGRELIRGLIDDVQTTMLCHPLHQQRIISSTTGDDPYLVTVSGTYQYYASAANIGTTAWKVERVYTGSIIDDDDEDVAVITTLGNYTNPALITFEDNPGTYTTEYRVRAYKAPTTISSESIEMDVPTPYHLKYVKKGVMALIEDAENGKSEKWDDFLKNDLPQFWWEMNNDVKQHIKTKYDGGY